MLINSIDDYKRVIGDSYISHILIVSVNCNNKGVPDAFYYCSLNSKAATRIEIADVETKLKTDWKYDNKAILCCDNISISLLSRLDSQRTLLRYYKVGSASFCEYTTLARIETARKEWARNVSYSLNENSLLFRQSTFSDEVEYLLDSAEYSSVSESKVLTPEDGTQITFDEMLPTKEPYRVSLTCHPNKITLDVDFTPNKSELLSGYCEALKHFNCDDLIRRAIEFRDFLVSAEQKDKLKLFYNFLLLFSYSFDSACSIKAYYGEVSKLNASEMEVMDFASAIVAIYPLPIASLLLYVLVGE